ncbi:hypothetical protein DESC_590056 [Desulfosarcina cetonica]|nr:hypothetical protein DESC_590056 [Desulfosarcina cetonica]
MPKSKCQLKADIDCQLKADIDYKRSEYHHLAFFIGHLTFLQVTTVKKSNNKPNAVTLLAPGIGLDKGGGSP